MLDCYRQVAMKKSEIARTMARRSGVTPAEAADSLDRTVHQIVTNLRNGRSSPLPGLGVFEMDKEGRILFAPEKGEKDESA